MSLPCIIGLFIVGILDYLGLFAYLDPKIVEAIYKFVDMINVFYLVEIFFSYLSDLLFELLWLLTPIFDFIIYYITYITYLP